MDPINQMENTIIDDALIPFTELIQCLTVTGEKLNDPKTGLSLNLEQLFIDLPVEFDLHVNEDGKVIIGSAPPTQHIETSIMPVFHQLKLRIERNGQK